MIDTHAHLDEEPYRNDLDSFIAAQRQAGVESILIPGVDVNSIEPVATICRQYPNYLYPAIGLHPENVGDDWQEQLETIHAAIHRLTDSPTHLPYIAIGEIGLDYHFDTTYKEQQHAALREQLNWAIELNLPVMLHVRDATEDALAILKEYTNSPVHRFTDSPTPPHSPLRGVMHCWSGSEEVARQIVNMGLYLGIGGIITFKNCKLREHLSSVPLERIVLETDAPYMAPVPHRGERNESRWITYVMEELSKIYGVSVDEIDRITTQNAKALFGL
ncbi:MAG: TatD family hydrolase [Paludibacteraceae bacterium]|nr:TatD family hydrolase [Paludibacteraceae bacterium]